MKESHAFENEADRYELWFKENNHLLDAEIEAIRQLLPDSGKGIEIGVGTGIFASALGIRDGVEPSLKMGERAEKRGIRVVHAKAEDLPVPDQAYQLALMVTVDCFLDDVLQAFREVWRILSSEGVFIIAFLDRETELGQKYNQMKSGDEFYAHADFHSSAEIIALLETAGFEIVDTRQTVYSLENTLQDVRPGVGDGVFAVVRAKKR